eukprot:scaffold5703_cov132-Cylindrotheca_fusiformis.AAC.7
MIATSDGESSSIEPYQHQQQHHGLDRSSSDDSENRDEMKDHLQPLGRVPSLRTPELRQRKSPTNTSTTTASTEQGKSVLEVLSEKKQSKTIDLETGKEGGTRSQCALIREDFEREPQSRRRRGIRKFIKAIVKPFRPKKEGIAEEQVVPKTRRSLGSRQISRRTISVPAGDDTQYQIRSIDEYKGKGFSKFYDDRQSGCCCGFSAEKMVTSYLFWAFRSSFLAVLVSAAVWFGWITFSFGALLYAFAKLHPGCMYVAGILMSSTASLITSLCYTSTTNNNRDMELFFLELRQRRRAILIAVGPSLFYRRLKRLWVTRVSSSAQVVFSDPILIRFGNGVKGGNPTEDDSSDESADDDSYVKEASPHYFPCPVLEFRLINRLAFQKKGEIIDASLNIVASVDSSQVPGLNGKSGKKRKKGKRGKSRAGSSGGGSRRMQDDYDKPSEAEMTKSRQKVRRILSESERTSRMASSDDPTVADRREFAKLYVESQDHPFFKRVWVARHILDQDSPLLSNDAKALIQIHGGRWPAELNSAAAVRASVHFDQILVSLSGTSNADANTVYGQKIYDYSDLVVGYRFCNMMYREPDGSLGVDRHLLNDVQEQSGGGGEELDARMAGNRKSKVDILIL